MEILLYLAELMQSRKQVGIPGLGTIYKKKSPGRYDAETHAFMPPSYTLDFSPELMEHEALAEYVSSKRNISIDSANYFIEQFADQTVQSLSEKNEADLGALGKLSTHNGELGFEPGQESIFGFEFYGLPQVSDEELLASKAADESAAKDQAETLPGQDQHDKEPSIDEEPATIDTVTEENKLEEVNPGDDLNPQADEQPVYEEISEVQPIERSTSKNTPQSPETPVPHEYTSAPEITPVQPERGISPESEALEEVQSPVDEVPEEEYEKKTPVYVKILLTILAIIVLIAVFYFINPKPFNTYLSSLKGNTDTTLLLNEQQGTGLDSAALQDSTQNTTIAADTVATQAVALQDTVIKYEIIVASLKDMKEASKFIAQMKRKGIETKVVDSIPGNRIKVSIATFTNETTAKEQRKKIARDFKDPGIYIYTNKPKK